jgi:hypothetical protein
MSITPDTQRNEYTAPVQSQGPRQKLQALTRSHFEPLYGRTLSDTEIDEIIENLAAYGRLLNEIHDSIVTQTRPVQSPATFPQSTQVRSGRIPHSLPQSGQPE